MLRQASRASPLRLVLLWSFCILHRVVPLTPKAIESVSLLEFWNLIADETQSVVLGVQIPGDDNGTLPRVAAAFAEYDRRRFRTDNTSHRESVLFRVTTQQLPFVNGPAVLVFTKQPTDYSCLVKPDVRTYPKQLEEYPGPIWSSAITDDFEAMENSTLQLLEYISCRVGGEAMHLTSEGDLSRLGVEFESIQNQLFETASKSGSMLHDECPEIAAFALENDPESFLKDYVSKNKPVVIRGGAKGWPAIGKWDTSFLRHGVVGDAEVHTKIAPGGIFEGPEPAEWWRDDQTQQIPEIVLPHIESPDTVIVRPATASLTMAEFLDLALEFGRGQCTDRNSGICGNAAYYLEYLQLEQYLPELQHDAFVPSYADFLEKTHHNVWIGSSSSSTEGVPVDHAKKPGTVGKLHFDPYENILGVVAGSKTFTLIDPRRNEELYEGHMREAKLDYNQETQVFERNLIMESTSMVNSPIDLDLWDADTTTTCSNTSETKHSYRCRYPLFAKTNRMRCKVEAGDILYLPSWWWHEVKSEIDSNSGLTLAMNYWFKPFFEKHFPCRACALRLNVKTYIKSILDLLNMDTVSQPPNATTRTKLPEHTKRAAEALIQCVESQKPPSIGLQGLQERRRRREFVHQLARADVLALQAEDSQVEDMLDNLIRLM